MGGAALKFINYDGWLHSLSLISACIGSRNKFARAKVLRELSPDPLTPTAKKTKAQFHTTTNTEEMCSTSPYNDLA